MNMKNRTVEQLIALSVLSSLFLGAVFFKTSLYVHNGKSQFIKTEKEDSPYEAQEFWNMRARTPEGISDAELKWEIRERRLKQKALNSSQVLPMKISDMGPGNFGGRIRTILPYSQDSDTLLVGGVAGGIWKTTDGGKTWRNVDDFLVNMSIGSLIEDPDTPGLVFMGTGEGFMNADAMKGLGIFVSDDFGNNWDLLPSTQTPDFYYVNRIIRIPNSQILLAATRTGIWRSANLGVSWVEVSGYNGQGRGMVDLKVNPTNPAQVVAACFQYSGGYILRSADYGLTFQKLGRTSGLPVTDVGRMELAYGTGGSLYVLVSKMVSAPLGTGNDTRGIWRSTDGGLSFEKTDCSEPVIEQQGWYAIALSVDPQDDNHVLVGALDVWESNTSGDSFEKISKWNPDPGQTSLYVHADIHCIVFHPSNSRTFWIGNDGGIYKTNDGGNTFQSLNNSLNIAQYYGVAIHPNGQQAIAGAQDNGTHMSFGESTHWIYWAYGDGGYVAWDQQEPNYIYGEHFRALMYQSADGGKTRNYIYDKKGFSRTGTLFIAPFEIDANDGQRMLVGSGSLLYTENLRDTEQMQWYELTNNKGGISAVAFHPNLPERAYYGTSSGTMGRTENLGPDAVFETLTGFSDPNPVTWICADREDPSGNTLYVTLGGYFADRVLRSVDNGTTFQSIHGDLPDMPVHCIAIDPINSRRLFLATELGLWTTELPLDGQPVSWHQYDYMLPFTRITQLRWGDEDTLWAATHGRGVFTLNRCAVEVSLLGISTDSCDQDNILDAGETALLNLNVKNTANVPIDLIRIHVTSNDEYLDIENTSADSLSLQPEETRLISLDITLSEYAEPCHGSQDLLIEIDDNERSYRYHQNLILDSDQTGFTGTFIEGAEEDTLFDTSNLMVEDGWVLNSSEFHSGTSSWFASDHDGWSLKTLTSPWFEVTDSRSELRFWLFYRLEYVQSQAWDGVVLEYRTANSAWTDINTLCSIPYDGRLFSNNPLYYRMAWNGNMPTWREATVPLGTLFLNQNIQFRFRLGTDTEGVVENGGFWLDDIQITHASWLGLPFCESEHCPGCKSLFYDEFQLEMETNHWPETSSIQRFVQILNEVCL
jgi:photosystem II stability/assembly factor-like uncharacterized protein